MGPVGSNPFVSIWKSIQSIGSQIKSKISSVTERIFNKLSQAFSNLFSGKKLDRVSQIKHPTPSTEVFKETLSNGTDSKRAGQIIEDVRTSPPISPNENKEEIPMPSAKKPINPPTSPNENKKDENPLPIKEPPVSLPKEQVKENKIPTQLVNGPIEKSQEASSTHEKNPLPVGASQVKTEPTETTSLDPQELKEVYNQTFKSDDWKKKIQEFVGNTSSSWLQLSLILKIDDNHREFIQHTSSPSDKAIMVLEWARKNYRLHNLWEALHKISSLRGLQHSLAKKESLKKAFTTKPTVQTIEEPINVDKSYLNDITFKFEPKYYQKLDEPKVIEFLTTELYGNTYGHVFCIAHLIGMPIEILKQIQSKDFFGFAVLDWARRTHNLHLYCDALDRFGQRAVLEKLINFIPEIKDDPHGEKVSQVPRDKQLVAEVEKSSENESLKNKDWQGVLNKMKHQSNIITNSWQLAMLIGMPTDDFFYVKNYKDYYSVLLDWVEKNNKFDRLLKALDSISSLRKAATEIRQL